MKMNYKDNDKKELVISGRWPVNPSPVSGEIPRIYYSENNKKLFYEFSDQTLEEENIECYSTNTTHLLTVWNKRTLFQKWTLEGMKALHLDLKPFMVIDERTGVIFGGFSTLEVAQAFVKKKEDYFAKRKACIGIYLMKNGYIEFESKSW